ncbi:MAG: hypothetical protein ABII88_09520 [Candidatus Omnitrophota bacterium]
MKKIIRKTAVWMVFQVFLCVQNAQAADLSTRKNELSATLAPKVSISDLQKFAQKFAAYNLELRTNYSSEGDITPQEHHSFLKAMRSPGGEYIKIKILNGKTGECSIEVYKDGKKTASSLGNAEQDEALKKMVIQARMRLYSYSGKTIVMAPELYIVTHLPKQAAHCAFGIEKDGTFLLRMQGKEIQRTRAIRIKNNIAVISAGILRNKAAFYTSVAHISGLIIDVQKENMNMPEQREQGLSRENRVLLVLFQHKHIDGEVFKQHTDRITEAMDTAIAESMMADKYEDGLADDSADADPADADPDASGSFTGFRLQPLDGETDADVNPAAQGTADSKKSTISVEMATEVKQIIPISVADSPTASSFKITKVEIMARSGGREIAIAYKASGGSSSYFIINTKTRQWKKSHPDVPGTLEQAYRALRQTDHLSDLAAILFEIQRPEWQAVLNGEPSIFPADVVIGVETEDGLPEFDEQAAILPILVQQAI